MTASTTLSAMDLRRALGSETLRGNVDWSVTAIQPIADVDAGPEPLLSVARWREGGEVHDAVVGEASGSFTAP